MKSFVHDFPNHIYKAIEIAGQGELKKIKSFKNVIISGLGGSGIGASIVGSMVANEIKVPLVINKGYFLPHFADKNTLVIINSYSGNTEETIHVIKEAIEKKLAVICITSGGEIGELAKMHGFPQFPIPSGLPPRASLGFSLVALLYVLQSQKLIHRKYLTQLNKAAKFVEKQEKNLMKEAEIIAKKIYNKIPVLYAADRFEPILIRWRQQINENAKQLCWHNVIPEMNHNELVGWRTKNKDLAVLIIKEESDYIRIRQRIELNLKTIQNYTDTIIDIVAKGNNEIEKFLYLILLGDWITCFSAELREFDPIEVHVINELKLELSKSR